MRALGVVWGAMGEWGAHESASLSRTAFRPFGVMYSEHPREKQKQIQASQQGGIQDQADRRTDMTQLVLTHKDPLRRWVPTCLINNGQNGTAVMETSTPWHPLHHFKHNSVLLEKDLKTNSPTWAPWSTPRSRTESGCAHGAPGCWSRSGAQGHGSTPGPEWTQESATWSLASLSLLCYYRQLLL